MINNKIFINPIFPNFVDIKSLSSLQQLEMKTKDGMEVFMWPSFAGSLSNTCAGFMTFVFSPDMAVLHP